MRTTSSAERPVASVVSAAVLAAVALLAPGAAWAMPQAPQLVCETYPNSAWCAGQTPACTLCHQSPPTRNDFGDAVAAALAPDQPRPLDPAVFTAELPLALMTIEGGDADGDGVSNLDELLLGSAPADPASRPADLDPPTCDEAGADADWVYDVCARDPAYTFGKVLRQVCGRSPSMAELDELRAETDPWPRVHATLDECLDSEHWRGPDGVLWSLANRKIKPTASLKAGADPGAIPLGDYEDDYNLFVYTQTDDRDARELLTAQYMVARSDGEVTDYTPFTRTPLQDFQARGPLGSQLVAIDRRAGMLTTRWFLVTNTMFTPLPRTTAAQAYRAYLGVDIARLEGLMPVAGEPVDYDAKTVTRDQCAVCHSTLDPLTYPFTRYEGLTGGSGAIPGSYNPARMERFADQATPDVASTPEAGVIFGQPVADLLAWAEVAADSDQFARATVLDYWRLLFGEPPRPDELDGFEALWRDFRSVHAYNVERMLHALIEMEAYSVP
ncbi:hypothetical protein [Haliangium sp.]|uniref:hypothetical protein n=1 Tax=Haliangium sp. TaxID=2663208 RepID=UPI003D13B6F8